MENSICTIGIVERSLGGDWLSICLPYVLLLGTRIPFQLTGRLRWSFTALKGKSVGPRHGPAWPPAYRSWSTSRFSVRPQWSEGIGTTPGWDFGKEQWSGLGLNNSLSADVAKGAWASARGARWGDQGRELRGSPRPLGGSASSPAVKTSLFRFVSCFGKWGWNAKRLIAHCF